MDLYKLEKHLLLLGARAADSVTGLEGVITTLSFDLYGCIQVVLTPPAKDGNIPNSQWLDITRLKILDSKPVMTLPDFDETYIVNGEKGSADKPLPR